MEKQPHHRSNIRRDPQTDISHRQQHGFETGNPGLNVLMCEWWRIFNKLATTPSPSGGDMRPIIEVATQEFQAVGLTTEVLGENGPVMVTIPAYNPDNLPFTSRILGGHLDVVKGTESRPEIDAGIVNSHGPAIDNKGPVAAIIAVTQYIVKNTIPHPDLRIVLTADEETDGQQIKNVPVGHEKRAFIADKSGSIGTIVTGSGGYTGIEAQVTGLSGEKALEFLIRFDKRMGDNLIARRRNFSLPLCHILNGREFTIETISVGPNNSRNTVPDVGTIRGVVACINRQDEDRILDELNQLTNPVNAQVQLLPGADPQSRIFEITFHGKAGHTSKAGTKEDDGFITVFSDVAATGSVFLEQDNSEERQIVPDQEVRINIGTMSSVRRGQSLDINFAGEARYRRGEDAQLVLKDLQELVEEYGGSMDIFEENGAYQLDKNTKSVEETTAVLEENGFTVNIVDTGFGISDANNAPAQWNTVVLSDGSINPHRSDEAISLESVAGLLQVFYSLATGEENIVLEDKLR